MPLPLRRKPPAASVPVAALVACAALAFTASAAAQGADEGRKRGGFTPRAPAGPDTDGIMDVYWLLVGISIFVALLVIVPLALFATRYRSRGRPRSVEGPQVRGNTRLEVAWTLLPIALVVIIIGFVFYKVPTITSHRTAADENADLSVRVEGRLFYWRFVYPNGVVSIDRLVLPVDQVADLEVTAPDIDVIHSFWVPRLHGKLDAIPGRTNYINFRPRETGLYDGVCAEFCGVQHAAMRLVVEVKEQEEFDAWLDQADDQQQDEPLTLGGELWGGVCAKCHAVGVEGAPPLEGNPILLDRNALETVVRNGRRAMPAVGYKWSEREMEALAEFAQVVGRRGGGEGQGDGEGDDGGDG